MISRYVTDIRLSMSKSFDLKLPNVAAHEPYGGKVHKENEGPSE